MEGFKALQGISGPQKFQIHKSYGANERLPSAHTWLVKSTLFMLPRLQLQILTFYYDFLSFNQLDLPEYSSKEQLQDRLLLAIHEASEGFGFG